MKDEKENRAVLFGTVLNETTDKVKLRWIDSRTNKPIEGFVMTATIGERVTIAGEIALCLHDGEAFGSTIRVADTYFCNPSGAEQQDTHDLWIEQGVVAQHEGPHQATEHEGPHVATEHEGPHVAIEHEGPHVAMDDDYDDTVPVNTTGFTMELSVEDADTIELDDDTADEQVSAKAKTAAQKAKEKRDLLYVKEDSELMQGMNTDLAKAMVRGKRHTDFAAWNFTPLLLPTMVVVTDPITQENTYVNYSHKGKPVNRILLNPNERDPDAKPTDIAHWGAVINPRCGQTFAPLAHASWMIPVANAVDGIEGVTYDRYCIKNGARGAMTIDLSDMATTKRTEAASNLTGFLNLDANSVKAILLEENGGHRCGVTMLNPLDGKGAFSAYLTVMRTYCGNLAMRGANQLMFKIRHTAGAIAAFDPEAMAVKMGQAFEEAQKHLLLSHLLRWIPIEGNMFDKMLTVFDKHGLITPPTVAIDVSDYDKIVAADLAGSPLSAEQKQSMQKIGRGQAYKAVLHGYANPDVDYVNLQDEESVGTAFHLMNAVTGMLTNAPIIVEDAQGKATQAKVLSGQPAGMEGFMKKSSASTVLHETIAEDAVKAYCKANGKDVLTTDDFPHMKQWFTDNPSAITIPNRNGKGASTPLTDVPEYHETWNMKVLTGNKGAMKL